MTKKISVALIAALSASLLAGCAKEPPKCSDPETLSLVRKIILDQIGGSDGVTETEIQDNMKFELPRASGYDEKVKKYTCSGKLIAGDSYQLPITYESQLDDKGDHIVFVDGISPGDLMGVRGGVIEGVQKSRAQKVGIAKAPETSTVPVAQPQAATPDLSGYVGQHPMEIFKEESVAQKFKTLLGKEYDNFFDSLSVASQLELKGDYYYGSGCLPHSCSIEESAFAINKVNGEVLAARLIEGKEVKSFGFSATGGEAPEPFRTWYKERTAPN